jgi:mono/diheme cytochrome c family protein
MKRSAVAVILLLAGTSGLAAEALTGNQPLDAKQTMGRNLFTQHCVVCHVRTQITSPGHYGPALSKTALGGQDDVMRELISNGTPNMPGFKYTFQPEQIDAIVAYVKMLPTPQPAAPAPAPH